MKRIIFLLIPVLILFTACGQNQNENSKDKKSKKISKRNLSITKANAYNDLFLDSMDVVKFIAEDSIPDSISRRITSFYNARNYEFAWFSSEGLSEQAMGFSSLLNFTNDTSATQKKLGKIMNGLLGEDRLSVSADDKKTMNTELLLTKSLIEYSLTNFEKGYVKRKELERFIPFKRMDPVLLSDSLLNKKHKDDKYFSDINQPYKVLSDQLRKYVSIVKSGGWPALDPEAREFKEGDSSVAIRTLKQILTITGDMAVADTAAIFDSNLKTGIQNIQTRFGYTANGKVDKKLIEQINVPAIERVKQILINMNRMRWLPQEPEGRLIVVNIPAFILHVYDGTNTVFTMPVVVGKEGHNTILFSDMLTTIVFSPYWNVPPSIVKKEILPAMEKDPDYLSRNEMEITKEENGLPVVRQLPGDKNSLGKVKFLFPNSFNIYFHDTPAKSLFDKDVRAYSHGCIRLGEPEKMAEYLLKGDPEWTPDKIFEAMNSGEEKYVKLDNPVPVFITYYTAWVDESGRLNFREDIYGHDKEVAAKMFL
jgi:murein L,D-transpeptidase YcbB/YkuD